MKNFDKPEISINDKGRYFKVSDGSRLFIYDYQPVDDYKSTIFIISGITGINHNTEKDIIELLSNNENRVVVVHPRGTGYSDGKRGDISRFGIFINDFLEIISSDKDYDDKKHKLFLFGHSMSTAVLLAIAENLSSVNGAILINPPFIQKAIKGMSPSFSEYLKYAFYFVFAKHKPIVNMAGNPLKIENEEDRNESLSRVNDPFLVKYFSLFYMNESRKIINKMLDFSKKADYPLLLIYGMKDNLVDKKGCDSIFENWKNKNKQYILIENGSHGKSTVKQASDKIAKWIREN